MKVRILVNVLMLCLMLSAWSLHAQQTGSASVSKNICTCPDTLIKEYNPEEGFRNHGNMYPVSTFLEHADFLKHADWTLQDSDSVYDQIFADDLNPYSGSYSFTAHTKDQVKIIHPEKTFTINLTPCRNSSWGYDFEISVSSPRVTGYDYSESFDSSAQAYYYLWQSGGGDGFSSEDIFRNYLMGGYDYYNTEDFNKIVTRVNTLYNLNVPLSPSPEYVEDMEDSYEYEGDEDNTHTIDTLIYMMQEAEIPMDEFLLSEYVLTDTASHIINKQEESNLLNLFRPSEDYRTFTREAADICYLHKQYQMFLFDIQTAVEVNSNVIRAWDPVRRKPLPDSLGHDLPADIRIYFDELRYEYHSGFSSEVKASCLHSSEIKGTGISIAGGTATIIAPRYFKDPATRSIPVVNIWNYPLAITDTLSAQRYVYDPLVRYFSGIQIDQCQALIPFKKKQIPATGVELLVNNYICTGLFKIAVSDTLEGSETVIIQSTKGPVKTTIAQLEEQLKQHGMDAVRIRRYKDALLVYFSKKVKSK